jgi:hypothetical protein
MRFKSTTKSVGAEEGGAMVKRMGVLGAVIGMLALVISMIMPAAAGDNDAGDTFRVVAITAEEDFLDLGDEGFSLGDQGVFSENLLKGGEEVGHSGGVCAVTSLEREEVHCVVTAWFQGGQITVQGLIGIGADAPDTFVLSITGGSGKYKGAEGEVHARSVSETKEILTFHFED